MSAAQLAQLSHSPAVEALAQPLPARSWPASLSALSVRRYRWFLGAQLVATTGLWMQRIAQDWLVLELSGNAASVGVVVALQFLPVLLFGLWGGVLADRYPKRLLLVLTQVAAALLALTLGVLALTGRAEVGHVYVIATLLGFVTVVDNPTRQVYVAELVGDQHLRNAVSLNSSVFQLGGLLGPALSGILISAVGQGWSFLLNGVACLLVVGVLVGLGRAPAPAAGARAEAAANRAEPVRRQLREGLAVIRRTSEVAWALALVGVLSVLGFNLPVILAAFADREFGTGVQGYSLLSSVSALGALAGALLSTRRREGVRLRLLVALLAGLGVTLALAALAPSPWWLAVALVVQGVLALLFMTGANGLVQMSTPPRLRGRVMSVYVLMMFGGQAIGGPVAGHLVDAVGPRVTLFACGALIALLTTMAGLVLAHRSRLVLELDLHPGSGVSPVHIVPAADRTRRPAARRQPARRPGAALPTSGRARSASRRARTPARR